MTTLKLCGVEINDDLKQRVISGDSTAMEEMLKVIQIKDEELSTTFNDQLISPKTKGNPLCNNSKRSC